MTLHLRRINEVTQTHKTTTVTLAHAPRVNQNLSLKWKYMYDVMLIRILLHKQDPIIESVDSISRDGPDITYM